MALLIVNMNGKKIGRLKLVEGSEYTIGRDKGCDLPLDATKGISRQHLRIFNNGEHWIVELLSKYGNLYYEGDVIDELLLDLDTKFKVPPYEFLFYLSEDSAIIESESDELNNHLQPEPEDNSEKLILQSTQDMIADQFEKVSGGGSNSSLSEKSLVVKNGPNPLANTDSLPLVDEHTPTGATSLTGIIKWKDEVGKKKGYKITEGSCVVGRSDGCDITIKNGLMSRRHFEISRAGANYYIVDLGSANGTSLNGKPVSKNQPEKVESGDRIVVMNLNFSFEVLDSGFSEKLDRAPALLPQVGNQSMPMPPQNVGARVVKVGKNGSLPQVISGARDKKNMMRLGFVAILAVLILFVMFDSPSSTEKPEIDQTSESIPYEKLSEEQKAVVRDSFNLAKNHFLQNKHALCIAEISKLHKIIPFYENSKEIENLCDQALDLERIQQDEERKRKERAYIEQRINSIIGDCRAKLKKFKTAKKAKACVGQALDLDPENALITEYLTQIEMAEEQKREAAKRAAKIKDRIRNGKIAYKRAANYYNNNQFRQAIDSYQDFLNSNYPDPAGYRGVARREIASAKNKLSTKIDERFNECKRLYGEHKYKDAIASCETALKEDPRNTQVKEYREQILSELRREMKHIYEDSILEENLGNIEAAKEKWIRIMEMDISTDEYYSKAKNRLKKYGIGI